MRTTVVSEKKAMEISEIQSILNHFEGQEDEGIQGFNKIRKNDFGCII
jgi:hypothetical protein